jgi:hypothetical protein
MSFQSIKNLQCSLDDKNTLSKNFQNIKKKKKKKKKKRKEGKHHLVFNEKEEKKSW